jgi:hypothetical protein
MGPAACCVTDAIEMIALQGQYWKFEQYEPPSST